MQNTENKECCVINGLAEVEDLVEKKLKIYSRLLTDTALAKAMEEVAVRHAKRKTELESLACGKTKKAEKRKNSVDTESDGEDEE